MSARDELVYFMRCINEREADGLSYWVVDDHDTMRIDLHKLAAEIQRTLDAQAAVIAAAKALLQRVPSALNSAFAAGAEEREHGSPRRQERCMEPVYAIRADIRTALADAARTGAR